jgi:hypothetical protein
MREDSPGTNHSKELKEVPLAAIRVLRRSSTASSGMYSAKKTRKTSTVSHFIPLIYNVYISICSRLTHMPKLLLK